MTRSERLIALGSVDAEWGEPALYAPDGYSFGSNPNGSKFHLVVSEPFNHSALCGVGVAGTTGAHFVTMLDKGACVKCITAVEATVRAAVAQ